MTPERCHVLVPYLDSIHHETDAALRVLERKGFTVRRSRNCATIDVARSKMATRAVVRENADAILFVDADVGFDPKDAIKLFERQKPVVAGVYCQKVPPYHLACAFADGVAEVTCGEDRMVPLKYAAAGFLRIDALTIMRMTENLPRCDAKWDGGFWPFFLPMVVLEGNEHRYLAEDWAFSNRCLDMGIPVWADLSIRLRHHGWHGYEWASAKVGGDTV